jgi:hypothetical protein
MVMKVDKLLCRACETENEPGDGFCRRCGLPLNASAQPSALQKCPRCQGSNDTGSFFCYTCGKYFAESDSSIRGRRQVKPGRGKSSRPTNNARVSMPGGSDIHLTGQPVFIERGDFDSSLPHDILMSVSRQHVLITYERGKYYVKDYGRDGKGSTNHTRLNGVDIYGKGKKLLKDGDKIELAGMPELTMTFKFLPDK